MQHVQGAKAQIHATTQWSIFIIPFLKCDVNLFDGNLKSYGKPLYQLSQKWVKYAPLAGGNEGSLQWFIPSFWSPSVMREILRFMTRLIRFLRLSDSQAQSLTLDLPLSRWPIPIAWQRFCLCGFGPRLPLNQAINGRLKIARTSFLNLASSSCSLPSATSPDVMCF